MPPSPNREKIQLLTPTLIRTLNPHSAAPPPAQPIVLSNNALNSIVQQARTQVTGTQDTTDAEEERRLRKQRLNELDKARQSSELTDIQKERKEQNNYLLAKAQLQKDEEEDSIKKLNEMVLEAKCMAIRDAQLEEKKHIQTAMKEEGLRLDRMMEIDRVNDIKKVADKEKKRKEDMHSGAAVIRKQIEDRKEVQLLEQEKKDGEVKQMLKQIAQMQQEDVDEKRRKQAQQHQMMEKVLEANAISIEKKKQMKIDSYEEDKRLMQYRLDQDKIAEAKEKENEAKKAEREKELSRLRSQQQKAVDKQAQQDTLRAERAFEQYERDWRRKEKETAAKHAAMEAQLQAERAKQQGDREHAIAVEAYKIRQNFEQSLARSKQEEQKLAEQDRQKHEANKRYAVQVQSQISEKEAQSRRARDEFFLEGVRQDKERKDREAHLLLVKERKLEEMRRLGVPEVYTTEIKRKLTETARMEAQNAGVKSVPPYATMQISQFDRPIAHKV